MQCFGDTLNGHSGCSSKGSFETEPKVQFCLHNIIRDCKDSAVLFDHPDASVSFRYSDS